MLTPEEKYTGFVVNKAVCTACKGFCCQNNACDNSPLDFDNDIQKMIAALDSGKYSIDFARKSITSFVSINGHIYLDINRVLNAKNEALYIRPRNVNRPLVDIIHPDDIEGPCIFWSLEKGCDLKYTERPMFGRLMFPIAPRKCYSIYNDVQFAKLWKPYTKDLFYIAKERFPEDWQIYKDFNFHL